MASATLDPELARQTLRIPRRPEWTEDMTAAELNQLENEAFLKWRAQIAMVEQQLAAPGLNHAGVTPFEKNVEVWKQLWRVIERSDVVVQIVDARDPLMFRCQDLEAYVAEVNPAKRCLLIINKADFLPLHLREAWASYLEGEGIDFLFFSAKAEADRLEAEAKALETYLDAGALEQHELLGGGGDSSASTGASSTGADDGASDSGDSAAP
ncbi:LSG1, partial [Symbiodinium sp. KB8]